MKRIISFFIFATYYLSDLFKAAALIAWDVVTISKHSKPGVIRMPLAAESDLEIMLLANLITFSPGTMVVDLAEDRSYMDIHTMFLESEQAVIDELKTRLESRLLEVIR